jgi:hypothetical protein
MNEQRPFDPQEAIENAQRLDMLRLQNEQTNLLRQMASGTNNASSPALTGIEKTLGVSRSKDPAEFEKRYKAYQKKNLKWLAISVAIGVVWLLIMPK